MWNGLCRILGVFLKFLYDLFNNYGVAMIVFSVILKIIQLPLSISQQKTTEKSSKLQSKMKELQDRYKNDPQKLNEAMTKLYKEEGMSPLGGCFASIIQIVLIFAMFYLVKSPLTYMLNVPQLEIDSCVKEMQEEGIEYKEAYKEIYIINNGKLTDDKSINMNFMGINLSDIPQDNLTNIKVMIIPILYIITSFLSLKISSTLMYGKKKKDDQKLLEEKNEEKKIDDKKEEDSMEEMMQKNSKMMTWMMPLLSVSIALIAPLGLALYWLTNNILQIIQTYVIKRFLNKKQEEV